MNQNHYRQLLIMGLLSFASMYVLMYAMVDTFENVALQSDHLEPAERDRSDEGEIERDEEGLVGR